MPGILSWSKRWIFSLAILHDDCQLTALTRWHVGGLTWSSSRNGPVVTPSETFNLRGMTLPFFGLGDGMNLPVVGIGDRNTMVVGVIFTRLHGVALEVGDLWIFGDAGELLLQSVGYTHCMIRWLVGRRKWGELDEQMGTTLYLIVGGDIIGRAN